MKAKETNTKELNQYRIEFVYIDNEFNLHTRYCMSYSKEEVLSLLPQITKSKLRYGTQKYKLLSIKKYNRFSHKWED